MRPIRRPGVWAVLLAGLAVLLAAPAPAASSSPTPSPAVTAQVPPPGPITLPADPYAGTAPGLEPGQIELAVTSTRSSMVSGGDARMEVRGLDPEDQLVVELHPGGGGAGTLDVTAAFSPAGTGVVDGLVEGFAPGPNLVTATATGPPGERVATLEVVDHPVTGPVISGPHQEPFVCQTEESGLGPPLDADCSIEPRVQWFARDLSGRYTELADPYAPYPTDTGTAVTRHGEVVPFVVRVESRTINRSITRIAVLDDPAARGAGSPYEPSPGWNGSAIHQFGESCGTGYRQGTNQVETVLNGLVDSLAGFDTENLAGIIVDVPARLAEGYAYVHSTLTIFGVHCNQVLSAETTAMVQEHLVERYGPVEQVLGVGASGGAIQQYTIIDGYPGLLDGGVPILSFPDVVTTAMSVVDCGLLQRVFDADPDRWTDEKRRAVTGFATAQICQDWVDQFLSRLDPVRSCGPLPEELRYHPDDNPGGARCTVQDSLVNLLGRDPDTGFARRPVENRGVAYGLEALRAGEITPEDFVDLNRDIGGYDDDAHWVPERMEMPADLAELLYRHGAVTGRGTLSGTPVIDLNLYVDLVPVLGFHDQVRAHIVSDRLAARGAGEGHAIWTGLPLPADAFRVAHRWADAIDAAYQPGADREAVVADAAPPDGGDRCTVPTSVPIGFPAGIDLPVPAVPVCDDAHQLLVGSTPRMVAGGPSTDDVIKCRLQPVEGADLPGLDAGQVDELRTVFPDGVCDWGQPGVGQEVEAVSWTSVGGDELAAEPFHAPDLVARSAAGPGPGRPIGRPGPPGPPGRPDAPGPPAGAPGPPAERPRSSLPATGGGAFPWAAGLAALALALAATGRAAARR